MNYDMRDYLEKSIELDKLRLSKYRQVSRRMAEGKLICKLNKKKTKYEYYIKQPGEEGYRYAGRDRVKLVLAIQNKRLSKNMIEVLENNIYWKQKLADNLRNSDPQAVAAELPKAYRPDSNLSGEVSEHRRNRKIQQSESDFKREELKLETSFGLFVRTKGECLIAELLYGLGGYFLL